MTGKTSEKAAQMIGNRYDLVLIASQRVRELRKGHYRKVDSTHTDTVAALEEIEQGLITRDYLKRCVKK